MPVVSKEAAGAVTGRNGRFPHYAQVAWPAGGLAAPWDEPFGNDGSPPTVLILDQVDVNRRLLRAMLKSEPYLIREARRAPEALEILAREKVDLVVLDLMMPGMSGPEFCRILKGDRRTQLVPVLMLTNLHGVENEVAGIASGAPVCQFARSPDTET